MLSAVEFCHILLRNHLRTGDRAIDATAGNGQDTLFLARQVGPEGRVFAFDLQPEAVESTRRLLRTQGISPETCEVTTACHSGLSTLLPSGSEGQFSAIIFNLGYLPGGDKSIITRPATTLAAVAVSLTLLRPGGLLLVVLYPGHEGGGTEAAEFLTFAMSLPSREFHVSGFNALNARAPAPSVVVILKSGRRTGSPASPASS